jgi:biotin--protein ligase
MIQKIIFAFFTFFAFFLIEASNIPTVYIYAGPGVSKSSLIQTENTMNAFLKFNYLIKHILPEQIIHDNWEKQTALLIVPGGADIPYMQALNGIGNQKIRSYVENGGAFLGICAGSYYGGNFVDFAKGTDLEVLGARELSFFPGIVRGPILAPYDYQSESGARAAKVIWRDAFEFQKNSCFKIYYNGGGAFVDADKKSNTTILACYDTEGQEAAIIECRVGSGKAILSGVHFEYDPTFLDADNEYLKQIIPALRCENSQRIKLIQHLLERLNLNCSPIVQSSNCE